MMENRTANLSITLLNDLPPYDPVKQSEHSSYSVTMARSNRPLDVIHGVMWLLHKRTPISIECIEWEANLEKPGNMNVQSSRTVQKSSRLSENECLVDFIDNFNEPQHPQSNATVQSQSVPVPFDHL